MRPTLLWSVRTPTITRREPHRKLILRAPLRMAQGHDSSTLQKNQLDMAIEASLLGAASLPAGE